MTACSDKEEMFNHANGSLRACMERMLDAHPGEPEASAQFLAFAAIDNAINLAGSVKPIADAINDYLRLRLEDES